MKISNDKYYTPKELAKRLIDKTFEILGRESITDIIEPSAGSGAFSSQIENCKAYDIEPEAENIIKQDFLHLDKIFYKKGRLIIGNPPFGKSNSLSVKFYYKATTLGDYIAFIQPISQLNNNLQMYYFDLIYSEDLGVVKYSDRELHCCFNIYKRPSHGGVNEKSDFTLHDIEIVEYRRGNDNSYKDIPEGYDYAMCNWGDGTFGKKIEYYDQYSQGVYFYCHEKKYLPKMLELLEHDTIRAYCNSISMKRMSKMRLYKYLGDNIDGIR